jgi:Uma2 family endonuclease
MDSRLRGNDECHGANAMPEALRNTPPAMTVADFLAWSGDGSGRRYQLVDGAVRAISIGTTTRGLVQATLAYLLANHLDATDSPCHALIRPCIAPRIRASQNVRCPALGVTAARDEPGQYIVPDPILLIEILSPGNASDTWDNVWSYTTIPSVREIVVVHSTRVFAELLRRGADGNWPAEPEEIGPDGTLRLESIAFACPLPDVYAQTHLARA